MDFYIKLWESILGMGYSTTSETLIINSENSDFVSERRQQER